MTRPSPIKRILRRTLRTSIAKSAVAAVTVAGIATVAMSGIGPAQAFDGPNGHHQFVQYNDKVGRSRARMWLYDANGTLVYQWDSGSHDAQTWWYTRSGGHLHIDITRIPVFGRVETWSWDIGPNDADGQCYLVPNSGAPRFTGDSATGGCTPD
jgi:hypothetical protein